MNNYTPTMGSLFSGFGGFELPAEWHGAKVLWQSEIEPWAVRVLKKHFPDVEQLGDIRHIDGSKIAPVDFITFGSPCQDMSVAGKRAGMKHICNAVATVCAEYPVSNIIEILRREQNKNDNE